MTKRKQYNPSQSFQLPVNDDVTFLLGGDDPDAGVSQRASERGLPLLHLPLAAIMPDPQQLRRLPHPDDLQRMAQANDEAAQSLVAGLHTLGMSIQQHGQLQPVIVYEDSDPQYPASTYRLLHGHRRWAGARLVGLPTLWAVIVPKPSALVRLLHQYGGERTARRVYRYRAGMGVYRLEGCAATRGGRRSAVGGDRGADPPIAPTPPRFAAPVAL